MIFEYQHQTLGDLSAEVTDYDKDDDYFEFEVIDEAGNLIDHKPFEQDLIKTVKEYKADSEAQEKFEDLKYE